MVDQIKYQADVVQKASSELQLFEMDVQSTLLSIRALPTSGLYYAMNNGSYSSAIRCHNQINNIDCELVKLQLESAHLADLGLSIMQAMDSIEQKMSTFVQMLGPAREVVDAVFHGVFSKAAVYQEVMKDMENKFQNMVKDFEDVIAVILSTTVSWQGIVGNANEALTSKLNADVSEEVNRRLMLPISGFKQMNYSALVAKNPDIERKGVKQGFKGEYWDPNMKMQCTLYAAARRTMIGRPLPANGAWGNAGSWASSAKRSGLEVSKTPAVGDVFCVPGYYGHVGVVEKVYADGSIKISEGNYNFNGAYNTRTLTPKQYANWNFIK